MRFKSFFVEIGKFILAGIIALIILTLFSLVYYNVPIRYRCEDGVTDCIRQPNMFYSRATEGFAWGKTNNEGYNNMFDYEENMQVDVLIMGSSNMEAYQVPMEKSVSSRLNTLLKDDTVYNIGMDGHSFIVCVNNLEAAINKYRPSKYVIIETTEVQFTKEDLNNAISGTVPEIPSYSGGIVGFLQKNPYLRLLNAQRGIFMEGKQDILNTGIFNQANRINEEILSNENNGMSLYVAARAKANSKVSREAEYNKDMVNKLLQKMNNVARLSGAEIIIVYHPRTELDEDGSLLLMNDSTELSNFKRTCEDNSIFFLDMSDRFLEEYTKNYVLPNGFSNTHIGSGHMNKYGHAMMADELYKLIEGER